MKSRRMAGISGFALMTVLGGALRAAPAMAQEPQDGPPPGQGPQGGPPPGGGPGGGGFGPGGQGRPGGPGQGMRPGGMNQPPINVTHIPIDVLASELSLTATQKDKIALMQRQFMQQARPPQPPQDGQGGSPPDPEAMRARMDKIRALDQSTTRQIENLLTPAQKQGLPALVKTLEGLRSARIPLEVVGDLHLTADQKQQLSALAGRNDAQNPQRQQEGDQARRSGQFGATRNVGGPQGQLHEKAMALLTTEQRKTVTDFMQKHPRPQGGPGFGPPPGGPGGQGGQGGPDMPPPPGGPGGEGGQGGPPPPPPGEPEG